MATFISDYLDELNEQWKEIDILLTEATTIKNNNQPLYNVMCRSATILIVAHMEGFLKDVAKNIISDYSCLEFKKLPISVKKTYCEKHIYECERDTKAYNSRINSLVADFESSCDFKVSHEPFIYNKNKNPKPDVLCEYSCRFGIKDIFRNLYESFFDSVFSNTNADNEQFLSSLITSTKSKVETFPYSVRKNIYRTKSTKYTGRSLWETFLDDLNQKRHKIVHGNDFGNSMNEQELSELKNKVRILQYGYLLIILSHLN